MLNALVDGVRSGESRVLVLRGEPGIGKTALLDHIRARAVGCRVESAAGIQAEMELPFAGLHQLVAPMLDGAARLPAPQRDGLRTAFGISSGPTPNRFLVGLAVLSLLSEVAEEEPLCCFVDDVQWLDLVSGQVLAFVGRRLQAESVGLVFTSRAPSEELAGLPELVVEGLTTHDANALLDSILTGPLDARIRERVVAEAGGNPLALLEMFGDARPADVAGGFGLPAAVPVATSIEEEFRARLDALPAATRHMLQVAAADPVGDPALVWRAAESLGLEPGAVAPAVEAGLLDIDATVQFRHPLVRSAAYRSASVEQRLAVHAALAEATDPDLDPDRRAWHLAAATAHPDEEVAAELERSAASAQARGGLAAAAAFLQRAVALTAEPDRRANRALAAAQASLHAGEFGAALELVAVAEAETLDDLQRAGVDLLHAQIAFLSRGGSAAAPLLLKAAQRLEPLDAGLARDTYLDAWGAASLAGSLATAGSLPEVSRAALAAPPLGSAPRAQDLLLEGLATLVTDGLAVAAPTLKRAGTAFATGDASAEQRFRWGFLANVAGAALWDDDLWYTTTSQQLQFTRQAGALERLPIELMTMAIQHGWAGDFGRASIVIAEADAVAEATGAPLAPYGPMFLATLEGREAEATALIESASVEAAARGEGTGVQMAQSAAATLNNGLGRYERASAAASQATEGQGLPYVSAWALSELVEASVRSANASVATRAFERLVESTSAAGTDWALGIEARCRALLVDGNAAETSYREAIERLGRTRIRTALARAHLLYGEWLRRENRRVDARGQLGTAHEMLERIGMHAFADRAARELLATGASVRARSLDTATDLTAQEAQVARLARDGLSNPEIGARLFISPRTVQYHLRKVFQKLDITSRGELHRVLAND